MAHVERYSLALETSSACASVALGCGDDLLEEVTLPPPRRHRVDLMPAVDDLCRRHRVTPADLAELFISTGPGSFTGLRIGITTAKALAAALPVRLVAVPTLDVLACNAPSDRPAAPCLNLKRQSVFTAVYQRHGDAWRTVLEPALRTGDELLAAAPRPLTVIGDPLPEPAHGWPAEVRLITGDEARPRAAHLWRLGRLAALAGRFVEPDALLPLYARPPEAVELWQARHGADSATPSTPGNAHHV
jgi:tRNA threonylcarbamoyladenosine biosynthesis protein TsaB